MYMRVIPRDLFNEANLLKCYGRMYLLLETMSVDGVTLEHDGDAFDVDQNESSGGISLRNVRLIVHGYVPDIERPLNARSSWPLYLTTEDDAEISVFDDNGDFTPEMLTYLAPEVKA